MTHDVRAQAHRRAALLADLVMAAAVGLLTFILLAPSTGVGTPATCTSTFGYGVPCGWAWPYAGCALAVGGATAVLVVLRHRRR